jgi:hypothetical protein
MCHEDDDISDFLMRMTGEDCPKDSSGGICRSEWFDKESEDSAIDSNFIEYHQNFALVQLSSSTRRQRGDSFCVDDDVDKENSYKRQCLRCVEVDRPPPISCVGVDFAKENQGKVFLLDGNWFSILLERYWEIGYHQELLENMFRALPRDLTDALKEALQALQVLSTNEIDQIFRPQRMNLCCCLLTKKWHVMMKLLCALC